MSYEIVLGDCLEVMRGMEAGSVDAVICDPPYGTTSCKWDSVIPLTPMWAQLRRVIKPNGAVVLFGAQPFTSALVMSNPTWFKYCWVWDKKQISNPQLAKVQPLRTHEDICVFGEGRIAYNPQGLSTDVEKAIKRRGKWEKTLNSVRRLGHISVAQEYEQQYTNYPKLIVAFPTKRNGVLHPTEKPVDLMAYLIRTYTNPGDTVLDFCMGSGTTGVAAIKEGRKFVGIEKDERYHAIAKRRLEDAAAQPLLFEMAE